MHRILTVANPDPEVRSSGTVQYQYCEIFRLTYPPDQETPLNYKLQYCSIINFFCYLFNATMNILLSDIFKIRCAKMYSHKVDENLTADFKLKIISIIV